MSITIQQALERVLQHKNLQSDQMEAVMDTIMQGHATPAQIAGFIIALRMKGESVDELTAAARVMRKLSSKVNVASDHLIDTCGTGGDGLKTFNVSTAAAIVAASAGARVAKHGNRSVSSSTGSADVLEALGVNLERSPEQIAASVDTIGIGFMFAPLHHSCMKHAIGPRKELGVRTLFNLLGPLTNPAGAQRQVLGVFDDRWLRPLAEVLEQLGSIHAMVVHAMDGLDEISIGTDTNVCELRDGALREYCISPQELGVSCSGLDAIQVRNATESADMIRALLRGETGPGADIVRLNAGAAIYVAGKCDTLQKGVTLATDQLQSGAAAAQLEQLVEFSHST